jgi:hypothetical protein
MPTIFIFLGFKFSFFSNDHEPVHVHIKKGNANAKFNILPNILLIKNNGFKSSELKMIESIIEENKDIIVERWKDFFKK